MLSEFALIVLFTVTLALFGSTHKPPADNATVQSSNSTDNVLPLNNNLASFSAANDSDKLLRRGFKRNRVVKRNGKPKKVTIPLDKKGRTQYTGKISVSSDEKLYDVVFGTASFEMWLISGVEMVRDESVLGFQNKYSPSLVATQRVRKSRPITVHAFGGYGTGREFQDTVKVGEISLKMTLVALSKVEGFGGNVGDGVFPMAPSPPSSDSFLSKAVKEGMGRVFAFALRQDGGELHLGMIDESYVDGEIKYHDRPSSAHRWEADGANIAVGTHLIKNARVVFVIESQFCRGPEKEVEAIYKKLGMAEKLKDGLYQIPCGSHNPPTMMVWWSDEEHWAIPPQRFERRHPMNPKICVGLFAAHTEFTAPRIGVETSPLDDNHWVLSYVFMQDLYTVFQMRGNGRIGLSRLKAGKGYGRS